jgi:hypothetical protein
MDKQFESFLNDLAGELKKAAECPVWEIPMNHRTKDSISAFRASVGMLSAIVVELVKKHRAPADQTEENADVVEADVFAVATEPTSAADPTPIASDAERLFDSDADKPRRRRSPGA